MIDDIVRNQFRIQDIVAKSAGVNLKDTVRVMRALGLVFHILEERAAQGRLNWHLMNGARLSNIPAPLHSKPDQSAVDACNEFYKAMLAEYEFDQLGALKELSVDPYFQTKVRGG